MLGVAVHSRKSPGEFLVCSKFGGGGGAGVYSGESRALEYKTILPSTSR